MSKSPEIEKFLEGVSKGFFGRSRLGAIAAEKCACCGGIAEHFKNSLSAKEYKISGMCQTCQDETFGEE